MRGYCVQVVNPDFKVSQRVIGIRVFRTRKAAENYPNAVGLVAECEVSEHWSGPLPPRHGALFTPTDISYRQLLRRIMAAEIGDMEEED